MLVDWKAIPMVSGARGGSEGQGICADRMSAERVVTAPDAVLGGKTHWHNNERCWIGRSALRLDRLDNTPPASLPDRASTRPAPSLSRA